MGEYEACLADVQRAYRRVLAARGAARATAQREYERAMEAARELGGRVRAAYDGHAA